MLMAFCAIGFFAPTSTYMAGYQLFADTELYVSLDLERLEIPI
jgi:hypothetical protein